MSGHTNTKFPESVWYGTGLLSGVWIVLVSPLTLLYWLLSTVRIWAYRLHVLKQRKFDIPVLVVGNISVGGTGKTPVVIAMVERLRSAGWKPGVVSRGYGGKAEQYPLLVTGDVSAAMAGDEPALIARRTKCPVVVDPNRSRAVYLLEKHYDVDIVISDDGLQHYAMARSMEIAVVDATRRNGNGWLLPAGPLRESRKRLAKVDAVLVNNGEEGEASFRLKTGEAVNLLDGSSLPLKAFSGNQGHAVAGIGNPQRFFAELDAAGVKFAAHSYPDHHHFQASDVDFPDAKWVLMTEKDAVKCQQFATQKHWYVPVEARFNSLAKFKLDKLLQRLQLLRT